MYKIGRKDIENKNRNFIGKKRELWKLISSVKKRGAMGKIWQKPHIWISS